MFRGVYGDSQKHQDDLGSVIERAWNQGIDKIMITVGNLDDAEQGIHIAEKDDRLFITMGCHPTRCMEFIPNPEGYFNALCKQIETYKNKIVAIGECGLDYDRLHYCEKDVQKHYFEKQLELAEKYDLPLFLHCRNSHEDFMEILDRNKNKVQRNGGVVHSFDGTLAEAQRIIEFGLHIGINGCSLKTEDNLKVVKDIPNDWIMIETDSPWCGVKPSHAGSKLVETKFPTVKKKAKWSSDALVDGRNEPCQIVQVLEIIAKIKQQEKEELAEIFYENTMKLFFQRK